MSDDEEIEYSRERFEEEKRDFEKQLDGIAKAPLGSLVELYHCGELKLPRCSSARYAHGIDLLNALACYGGIVAVHEACVRCAQGSIIPLMALLSDGADVNACNEAGLTAFECFAKCERRNNRINELVRYFFKHLHRLAACQLHLHPQNQRQYDLVRGRHDMRHFVEQQLKVNYDDELHRMNNVKLKGGWTLRDVLREDTDLRPAMSEIETMITDDSFEAKFPQLWCLVKLRYKQLDTRLQWKPLINDAFRALTRRKLPENCVDIIIDGLMNYDLANLLTVAFNVCLRTYKINRRARRNSNRLSSPRKMLPRI